MTFADLVDAFCAKMYLNNIELPRDKAKLSVEFMIEKVEHKNQGTQSIETVDVEERKTEIPKQE